jgi:hypothetical protein
MAATSVAPPSAHRALTRRPAPAGKPKSAPMHSASDEPRSSEIHQEPL